MKKFFRKIALPLLSLVIMIMLIIYSKDVSETIRYCMNQCISTLIPSLFAYMTLCSFLIKSNLSDYITTPLWLISRRIIKLDKRTFSVFILSLIAGYPAGMKMLKELISQNKNYNEIAARIAPVCFASGPAFIIGFAGNIIYNDTTAGMIIFLSCTMSNILGAIFFTRKNKIINNSYQNKSDFCGKEITDIILSSAKAMLMICLSMILFNIAIMLLFCFLNESFLKSETAIYIRTISEITNISSFSGSIPLWITTFFISFGGLCVIFQVFLISDGKLKLLRFIFARIILSALSSVICFIITGLTDYQTHVPVFHEINPLFMIKNPLVLISIGFMTIILLILMYDEAKSFKKNKNILKKDWIYNKKYGIILNVKKKND